MNKLTKKQKMSIKKANRRINLWDGSIRSGKTIASIVKWIFFVANAPRGGKLVMIGKTERALKNNVLDVMAEMLGDDFRYTMGSHKAVLFGRVIEIYGANDERSEGKIRGMTVAGAYCDEITLWPESMFKALLGRMSVKGAQLFGTTNPDSPHHWLKANYIDRAEELDLAYFHFELKDNAKNLDPNYVRQIQLEYVGLWFSRFILGLWVLAEGAIYDFFEEKKPYIIEEFPKADRHAVTIDYGTQNPCVFLLIGENPYSTPKCWAEREYYYSGRDKQRQKTDSEYADDLEEWLDGIVPYEIIVDPSAKSFILELRKRGFYVKEADNAVLDGIRTQSRMLKSGEYAVGSNCPETIKEYSGYLWDPKAQKRGEDKPLKERDHTKDAERYYLHTKHGKNVLDYSVLTRTR